MEFTLICMLEFRSAYHICFILRVRVCARVSQDLQFVYWSVDLILN